MPPVRYINNVDVQGWEPSLDGSDDADLFALDLPSSFSFSPATLIATRASNAMPENTSSTSRRQAPSTRAQAAAYSSVNAFVGVARSGESSHLRQVRSFTPRSVAKSATAAPSARNAAAAGRSGGRPRSSTERKIARKLAENADYVPRPRNSFILFRTEFVAKRAGTNAGPNARDAKNPKADGNDDEEDEESQSLSKQASAIWNNMDEEEKHPWTERAKVEKAEHEAKYPNYRYKPVRQGSARKNTPVIPKKVTLGRRSSPRRVRSEASPLAALDEEALVSTGDDVEQPSGVAYYPPASSINGALEMPAPMRMSSLPALNPASSSLANALGSPTPTPERVPAQIKAQVQSSGPTIPTVPRVPALDLSASGSSCATGLPSIPRSPSAPIFDARLISQYPQNHITAAGFFQGQVNGVSLYPFRSLAASCPSTPHTEMRTTSPLSPGSSTSLQSALPTPEGVELEYFRNSDHSQAGLAYEFLSQQLFTNEDSYGKQNDEKAHIEMDVDMHSLFNLSSVAEISEFDLTHTPLEAVAALWVQDQQQTTGPVADPVMEVDSQLQIPAQISPIESSFVIHKPEKLPSYEAGLNTYVNAIGGTDYQASGCGLDEFDSMFRLDLDLELGCATRLPASALSFSALGGESFSTDDIFGYDRERGLYGSGYELSVNPGLGSDYGL